MKYDDASWHSGGDFPQGLDESAAATHIGMFVAWAASRELLGVLHTESSDAIARLRTRTITPGAWFIANCDGKLTDEDLNEEGNRFTQSYFACDDPLNTRKASYLLDYYAAFPNVDSLYEVPDNWDTFDCIDPILNRRFSDWKMGAGRPPFRLLDIPGLSWMRFKK